jgi:hypothetical protein
MTSRTLAVTAILNPLRWVGLLAFAGLLGLLGSMYQLGRCGAAPAPVQLASVGPRIEDVRRLARLAVLRVQVADVIEGRSAGAEAAVFVRGDADLVVDLEQVEIVERDEAARVATVVLPRPHAERARVDHDRTRLYTLRETGLAAWNPFADARPVLLADAMRAAQEAVARAVRAEEFVVQAQQQAETLLRRYGGALRWDICVRWEDRVVQSEAPGE